jgi:hypothetical protein
VICDEDAHLPVVKYEIPAVAMPTSREYREGEGGNMAAPDMPVNISYRFTWGRVTNGVLAQVALVVCAAPWLDINYRPIITLQTSRATELYAPQIRSKLRNWPYRS